jgi:S1-C subfamily serine protease
VPIEVAEKLRSDYLRFGEARHGWIGINVSTARQPVEGSLAEMTQIERGSPAANSGIKPGDILLQVGQRKVTQPEDVPDASFFISAGDTVPITVVRGNQKMTFNVQATLHPRQVLDGSPAAAAIPSHQAIPLKLDSEPERAP